MTGEADIEAGHDAFRRQNWKAAYDLLASAGRDTALDGDSLETLANAAYLIAKDKAAVENWTRAHNAYVDQGEIGRAARIGFVLSLTYLLKGEGSNSSGWLARTQRLLDHSSQQHVEEGFCLIILGLRELYGGDREAALSIFKRAMALGTEFQDSDLLTLALLSEGEARIALGQYERGATRLDEAMVSVIAGKVAPILSGIVYCAVILACQRIFDSERAREWTHTFNEWCEAQPDLVPFRGQCLVHRSEILQMKGDWPGATEEAERALRWLRGKSESTVGRAHYQRGELHRLAGEFDQADQQYQQASRYGVDPQPGLALLRLEGGQIEDAAASIRTACGLRYGLSEISEDPDRLKLLGPSVEIFLSAGETDTARAAAEELAAGAQRLEKPVLLASAAAATGAVLATTNQSDQALASLNDSLATWQRIGMPYEAARTRIKIADVCHRLGDHESAVMHSCAARAIFQELGASSALVSLDRLPLASGKGTQPGLTQRQLEVLRLLANGRSNREIGAELRISEHTVARHISNIFDKTGVSSRTAAVAFAHRHKLLR